MASTAIVPAIRHWSDDFHSMFVQYVKSTDAAKEEEERKKKDDKKKKGKKKTKKERAKERKEKKDSAGGLKHVPGPPELSVAPNPSDFNLFAKVRQVVLEDLLDRNRSAIAVIRAHADEDEDSSDEEKPEAEDVPVPKVVGLGICGVFELIKDARTFHPALCARALAALLNVLQGQEPEGLHMESTTSLECLHKVLVELVSYPVESEDAELGREVQSLACACLLSLVVAWGKTGPLLAATSSVLITAAQKGDIQLQVPEVLSSLQRSVQAACVGYNVSNDWSAVGITEPALVDRWPVYDISVDETSSLAVERSYAYLFSKGGLFKIGTGHDGTIKGYVYATNKEFYPGQDGWLGCVKGKLFFWATSGMEKKMVIVNSETLQEEGTVDLEYDAGVGPVLHFVDGDHIGQLQSQKSGLTLRLYDSATSPMQCIQESKPVVASHTVLACGEAPFLKTAALHECYFDHTQDVIIKPGREFSLLLTSGGKLLCCGSGAALAFSAATTATDPGTWTELETNIKQVAVGCNSNFIVTLDYSNKVALYGHPYNGEDGSKAKNRRSVKLCSGSQPAKLASVKVTSVACSSSGSAYVSDKGQLYLLGQVAAEFTDSATGIVLGLLGIEVQTCAMGKGHVLAMTNQGMLYSFGLNNRGQCGRDETSADAPPEDAAVAESATSEDDAESIICKNGQHSWVSNECLICTVCGQCTGYGVGCCNVDQPNRVAGEACGCGSGFSGCEMCGCCRGCAKKNHDAKDKSGGKKKDKAKLKKSAAGKSLFRPGPILMPVDGSITVEQIAAGNYHSVVLMSNGDVYTFGGNFDGQLGIGSQENSSAPVKVDLPVAAKQVAAGGHHTVILLTDGRVVTFGKDKDLQLGRKGSDDDKIWASKPGFMEGVGCGDKLASWVGAGATTTYVRTSSSLLTEENLEKVVVFANPHCLGIVSNMAESPSSSILFYDRDNQCLKSCSDQASLAKSLLCYEPSYSLLYRLKPDTLQMDCFDVFASHAKSVTCVSGQFGSTIFSPELSFPRQNADHIAASQVSLHLLACLSHLNNAMASGISATGVDGTPAVPGTSMKLGTVIKANTMAKDYMCACRFKESGGPWGSSRMAVDAVGFCADKDVLLCGIGLYGDKAGSCKFTASISVEEAAGSRELVSEFTTNFQWSSEGPTEYCHCLLPKPVKLQAGRLYNILATVYGSNRTDSGTHGFHTVTVMDEGESVTVRFQDCNLSTNGTSKERGQIPAVLLKVYRDQVVVAGGSNSNEQLTAHVLRKQFSTSVSEDGFTALLRLLRWSWDKLCLSMRQPMATGCRRDTLGALQDLKRLAFITSHCLQILQTFILVLYPPTGAKKAKLPEEDSLVVAVGDSRVVLCDILGKSVMLAKLQGDTADAGSPAGLLQQTLDQCYKTFVACFHAFYPSIFLRWTALFALLNQYTADRRTGSTPRTSRHLAAVMEALAQPTQPLLSAISSLPVGEATQIFSLIGRSQSVYPKLEQHMADRIQEQGECEMTANFKIIVTQLLYLVMQPVRELVGLDKDSAERDGLVVTRAGDLLSALVGQLALDCRVALEGGPLILSSATADGDEMVLTTPNRFVSTTDQEFSSSVHSVMFSVDREGVMVAGVLAFGAKGLQRYEVELLQSSPHQPMSVKKMSGSLKENSFEDSNTTAINFDKPVSIQPGKEYIVNVRLEGEVSCDVPLGNDVEIDSVKSEDGVTFCFSASPLSNESSLISNILYINTLAKDGAAAKSAVNNERRRPAAHIVQLSVTLLENCSQILDSLRSLSSDKVKSVSASLGDSYVFSTLLPLCLAYLSPVVAADVQLAIDVIALLSTVLPCVAGINQLFQPSEALSGAAGAVAEAAALKSESEPQSPASPESVVQPTVETTSGDGSGGLVVTVTTDGADSALPTAGGDQPSLPVVTHHVVVESDHPYAMATCSGFQVGFPSSVKWMLVEFDSRCGTAQPEDVLGIYMSRHLNDEDADAGKPPSTKAVSMSPNNSWPVCDESFSGPPGGKWPKRPLVIAGHQLAIWLETASDYAKDNDACRYGFRCTVTGYEWSPTPAMVTVVMERELAYLTSVCAVALMRDDIPLVDISHDKDNIHPAVKQLLAEEEFIVHKEVLQQGLGLNHVPSITEVLHGHIAWQQESSEQQFLDDLINLTPNTSGGRLARWLQPTLCIDAKKCQLKPASESLYSHWLQHAFSLTTCDSEGQSLFVAGMKVECVATPVVSSMDNTDPSVYAGLPVVNFSQKYKSSEVPSGVFQSITAMKEYERFSFEEIRLQSPRESRTAEKMDVVSHNDGRYEVIWSPSVCGEYTVCVLVDGCEAGEQLTVVIEEPPSDAAAPPLPSFASGWTPSPTPSTKKEKSIQNREWMAFKRINGELRIRCKPSLQAGVAGMLQGGSVIKFAKEEANDDGRWVQLAKVSAKKFTKGDCGWVLAYSSGTCENYLEDVEDEDGGDTEAAGAGAGDPECLKASLQLLNGALPAEPPSNWHPGMIDTLNEKDPIPALKAFKQKLKHRQKMVSKKSKEKASLPEGGAGEYTVVHCGSLGHNVRKRCSREATPVGLLTRGSTVTAIASIKNRQGLWIRLGDSSVAEYCEANAESWTLAASSKGVTFLQKAGGGGSRSKVACHEDDDEDDGDEDNESDEDDGVILPVKKKIKGNAFGAVAEPVANVGFGAGVGFGGAMFHPPSPRAAGGGGGGLFGAAAPFVNEQPGVPAGGLFGGGGGMGGHAGGGLFGAAPAVNEQPPVPAGGLFGGGGGWFGAPAVNEQPVVPAGGLFGGGGGGVRAGGLFGAALHEIDNPGVPGGGLFGDGLNVAKPAAGGGAFNFGKPGPSAPGFGFGSPAGEDEKSSAGDDDDDDDDHDDHDHDHDHDHDDDDDGDDGNEDDDVDNVDDDQDDDDDDDDEDCECGDSDGSDASDGSIVAASYGEEEAEESEAKEKLKKKKKKKKGKAEKELSSQNSLASGDIPFLGGLFREDSDQQDSSMSGSGKGDPGAAASDKSKAKAAAAAFSAAAAASAKAAAGPPLPKVLSPAVAQCLRTVLAAFLWHGSLVHDAMASASYLKFHPLLAHGGSVQDDAAATASAAATALDEALASSMRGAQRRGLQATNLSNSFDSEGAAVPTSPPPPAEAEAEAEAEQQQQQQQQQQPQRAVDVAGKADGESGMSVSPEQSAGEVAAAAAEHSPPMPPTLRYLVRVFQQLSEAVLRTLGNEKHARWRPSVPQSVSDLLARAKKDAKAKQDEEEKVKKKKQPDGGGEAAAAGDRTDLCELCQVYFPSPVTYHMREAHPGCGRHAQGKGYNSQGRHYGGWAGNCGDGGRGGSTWYLMCNSCRTGYLERKSKQKRVEKSTISANAESAMLQRSGDLRPRPCGEQPAHRVLTENARFLLRLAPCSERAAAASAPLLDGEDETSMSSASSAMSSRDRMFLFQKMMSQPSGASPAARDPPDEPSGSLLQRALSSSCKNGGNETCGGGGPFQRSVSMAVDGEAGSSGGGGCNRACDVVSGGDVSLLHKPSHQLKKLVAVINRAGEQNTLAESAVVKFISQAHDLESLQWSMEHSVQLAACRQHALTTFDWVLRCLSQTAILHDVLWMFSSSLNADPVPAEAGKKAEAEPAQLGNHPLLSLQCSGQAVMQLVRSSFHGFLSSVAELLKAVPCGSLVQQAAIRCLALRFHPDDHAFLHRGQVFSTISDVLAKVDEKCARQNMEALPPADPDTLGAKVFQLENVLPECELKMSSRQAMANSLTDGDTETFWESGDEDRQNPKYLQVTCGRGVQPMIICVHIDNSRDNAHRVNRLVLSVADSAEDETEIKKATNEVAVETGFAGWVNMPIPMSGGGRRRPSVVRVTLTAVQMSVRLRQVLLLGTSDKTPEKVVNGELPPSLAHSQMCQAEALHVFRQLTSQVFGRLLSGQTEDEQAERKAGESTDLREQVVGILFSEGKPLTQLQKQVCEQMVRSLCSESARVRAAWSAAIAEKNGDNNGASKSENGKISDSYCMELLSMLLALSRSPSGSAYLAQQFDLLEALVSLLHTTTDAVQIEVLFLLSHVFSHVAPGQFAHLIGGASVPPAGYCAIMHAQRASLGQVAAQTAPEVLDIFLACISKALSVQVRVKGATAAVAGEGGLLGGKGVSTLTSAAVLHREAALAQNKISRWYMQGTASTDVAQAVIRFLREMCEGKMGQEWATTAKASIAKMVMSLTTINETLRDAIPCLNSHQAWLSFASLCVLSEEHIESLSSGNWSDKPGAEAAGSGAKPKATCENHDDGETRAIVECNVCGSLCGECDRVLHMPKRTKSHQRQVFKEEEEAIKVEVHEGCGRVKLYWLMALADPKALRAMVEFRDIQAGIGSGAGPCRFCGSGAGTAMLAIGSVCSDQDCQQRAREVCTKTLPCGHQCGGVVSEETCLPCLHGCKEDAVDGASNGRVLRQDADDMCIICYSEPLSAAPAVQLSCGHVYHKHCCDSQIDKRWVGPRITFRFLMCPICENRFIEHPLLASIVKPMMDLHEEVKRKASMRLEYENQTKNDAVTRAGSKFHNKPELYAMDRYAYYVCHQCSKAYFGGEARCVVQAAMSTEYDPTELVCGACSNVEGAQVCPKHGTDFLEYKCRYCCSVAVYFCFGTTHFCTPCHDDFQRLGNIQKGLLPSCPVGPTAVPLDVAECPLRVAHPPTGEEFALGCGVCRNAQTF